ncbi:MAG: sigma-54 interaction domain-containing protein [Sediminispirochaetaceae bacterium]
MEKNRLCAWLGRTDIQASAGVEAAGIGPIAQALADGEYECLTLLSNYPESETADYRKWLVRMYPDLQIDLHMIDLSSPTEYPEIYEHAVRVLRGIGEKSGQEKSESGEEALTFHLSPGTPAMAATWIIIASSVFPARLIETSREKGVRTVDLPFDILAEYRPRGWKKIDQQLIGMSDEMLPETPAFDEIIHTTEIMQRTVNLARRLTLFDVPVLLLGDSGTGKELFAKAIHNASDRAGGPFVSVNCGALPQGLVESELFGYEKGAFTGAEKEKEGYIEAADGGTLFLDEIGELPLNVQVLLLRVLQDRSFQRVGSTRLRSSNFRLISATNRDLAVCAADGSFRGDLFHRIAVGVLKLPPLRSRGGDIDALADFFLKEMNTRFADVEGWQDKTLAVGARKLLHEYEWPGNIRELINTLTRACLWSPEPAISRTLLEDSLVRVAPVGSGAPEASEATAGAGPGNEDPANADPEGEQKPALLGRPIGDGFSLEALNGELMRHYLRRAMEQAFGNKTKAAELLGLPNYQTLTNWLKRYGVEG